MTVPAFWSIIPQFSEWNFPSIIQVRLYPKFPCKIQVWLYQTFACINQVWLYPTYLWTLKKDPWIFNSLSESDINLYYLEELRLIFTIIFWMKKKDPNLQYFKKLTLNFQLITWRNKTLILHNTIQRSNPDFYPQ